MRAKNPKLWGLFLFALLAACGENTETTDSDDAPFVFREFTLQGDPSEITSFRFIPGTDEFLLLRRTGEVLHYRLNAAQERADLLGQFQAPGLYTDLDCGLISITFDPAYTVNHYVYLGQCVSETHSAIQRLIFDYENPSYAGVAATAVEVIQVGDVTAERPWHNVGAIGFDGDDNLYAFFGDKRVSTNGQDASNDLGALIRIIPKQGVAEPGFDMVMDNPFVLDPTRSNNIYAYGLRSPWMGFLDSQGRYWIGDVGENDFEEINVITTPGENLGWVEHEGPCNEDCEGFSDPVLYWNHSSSHQYVTDDSAAESKTLRVGWVGLEYTGMPLDAYDGALTGKVLFGDMCVGFVRAAEINGSNEVVSDEHVGHLANATGWNVGPDGYVYAVTFSDRCSTAPGASFGQGKLVRMEREDD